MLIPLRDDIPKRRPPAATVAVIAACVLVFLYQLTLSERGAEAFALGYGMIPSVLFGTHRLGRSIPAVTPWLTVLTSMFVHGSVLHIAGNMIYLWVFGPAVENALGHARYLAFYLLCGVAAAMTQALVEPAATIPMIGASGAISGVLGAYLLLFPRARIRVLLFYFLVTTFDLPAKVLLLWWIAIQLLSIFLAGVEEGGVAWYAHVGGFVGGMVLIWIVRPRRRGPWG